MKKLLAIVMVLAIVAGISFALEVGGVKIGGSTAAAIINNETEGVIEIDQEVGVDIGALHFDAEVGIDVTLPAKEKTWEYEVGASYTFLIFKVGSSLAGEKDLHFDEIKAYVDIASGPVGGDVDVLFSADQDNDPFQGADISAFWKPGPAEIRIGYLYTEVGDGGSNAPEELTDGGIYAKIKVSY